MLIRLITRLIFVWFIKQKDLIPNELFDKGIIDELINYNDKTNSTYYKSVLQNLFFSCLNLEHGKNGSNRVFIHENSDGQGFKYRRFFIDSDRFIQYCNKIPFLNGGLFDPLLQDCFSNLTEDENKLVVPDHLFFDEEHGLINILSQYNFTVEESTHLDQSVSLDPELLGKVFENLLGTYNPETRETARKKTGSFYTPREVVQYMVNKSLMEYLKTTLSEIPNIEAIIENLFAGENKDITNIQKEKLVTAIYNCKIIDPACGSGAFPMGLLHQMVFLLNLLDEDNEYWRSILIKQIEMDTQDKLSDREEKLNRIKYNLDRAYTSEDYAKKLYLIQNCIYCVDIQPIAIQIAKLRFFISLVIEQTANRDMANNFGIQALPNLETKFVAANTLLYEKKIEINSLFDNTLGDKVEELYHIRKNYFNLSNAQEKQNHKKRDESLRKELQKLYQQSGECDENELLFLNWDPYDLSKHAQFFFTEMFNCKEFDIVIGNPPYIQLQGMNESDKRQLEYKKYNKIQTKHNIKRYETYKSMGDIYQLFYELGLSNLCKDNAILCYITSNKWMRSGYGASTREFFAKYNPILVLDLGPDVFEGATVDVNIILIQKSSSPSNDIINIPAVNITKETPWKNMLFNNDIKDKYIQINKCSNKSQGESWIINNKIDKQILTKINKIGKPLGDWDDIKINYGIKTGFNEAFIIDSAKRDDLVKLDPKSAEIIKPILRGRDIKKYKAEWAGLWVIATFPASKINIDNYPAVKNYLQSFGSMIEQSGENGSRKKTGNKWFETQDQISYFAEFEKEKIIYPEISQDSNFNYTKNDIFVDATGYCLTGNSLLYLLILLNSTLITTLFKKFISVQLGANGFRYQKQYVEIIKIPQIDNKLQQPFINLANEILVKKESNEDTLLLEKKANQLVYKLYDLTQEEIDYIESK